MNDYATQQRQAWLRSMQPNWAEEIIGAISFAGIIVLLAFI